MRDETMSCEIDRGRSIAEKCFARVGRVLSVTGMSSMSKLDTAMESVIMSTAVAEELTLSTRMSIPLSQQQSIIIIIIMIIIIMIIIV